MEVGMLPLVVATVAVAFQATAASAEATAAFLPRDPIMLSVE
jgi:hypothetical protein